jgi:hypothetical protein
MEYCFPKFIMFCFQFIPYVFSPFFDSYLQSGNSLLYILKILYFKKLFVRNELNLHMYVYLLAFFQFSDFLFFLECC